jgi:MYXO-CTERM domain-containing protein
MSAASLRHVAAVGLFATGLGTLGLSGCAAETGEEGEPLGFAEEAVSVPKKAYCSVNVIGKGSKDMEKDYLPHVITCENGGANLQALKAQAIAARSVAYYNMATKGSICDSQGCQVYGCGAKPSERAYKAVAETAGMILSYNGTLTYGFYVAGDSNASPPGCRDSGGYTSHYVTYNAGKTGGSVTQTRLGYVGPPGFGQNRGCMSQWGARCLENRLDYDFQRILRFYYGADIKIVQAAGDCVKGAAPQKTVKAKLVRKWSNAKRYRGKQANYVVCAGKPFAYSFTFKNVGSATWRDVEGRGDKVGSDVFLVTASGKKDKLTRKVRYSVKKNKNPFVRGDRKAKNCSDKRGCRKTGFIKGGMLAKAPSKPGIYTTRWRLRDYSKAHKAPKGFGPKVELKFKVMSCQPKNPDACGCRVWCTNGESSKITASITSLSQCKAVGATTCKPAELLAADYQRCDPPTGTGGSGGTSSGAGGTSSGAGGTSSGAGGTSSGAGGTSSGAGGSSAAGAAGAGGDTGGGDPEPEELPDSADDPAADDESDPNGIPEEETPDGDPTLEDEQYEDDADYYDDGFDGDEERIYSQEAKDSASCSMTTGPAGGAGSFWAGLAALGALALGRRRKR